MSWIARLFSRRPRDGAELPPSAAQMSETRARELAHREAQRLAVPWEPPVSAALVIDQGRPRWVVRSNWPAVGFGLDVVIDDATAEIVRTHQRLR